MESKCNHFLIDDNIELLKNCPNCDEYYPDGLPYSLVGKPQVNGIRPKYTEFKCRFCNSEFISFDNWHKLKQNARQNDCATG